MIDEVLTWVSVVAWGGMVGGAAGYVLGWAIDWVRGRFVGG